MFCKIFDLIYQNVSSKGIAIVIFLLKSIRIKSNKAFSQLILTQINKFNIATMKMEIKSQKLNYSTRKLSQLATSINLRSTSYYKSMSSTSTMFPNRSTHRKNLFLQYQNNYLTTRARSSLYNSLSSTCWCLFDQNSNTQLGFRKTKQREIASLTKIMTTIIGLELMKKYNISPSTNNIDEDTLIRITQSSTKNIGTTAGLKVNNWIFLKDLFYGIMLPSGNDAAQLLSEFMGYILSSSKKDEAFSPQKMCLVDLTRESTAIYIAEFVKYMNYMADVLGLTHTQFSNPHGLQNAMNISTAKDIITLSIYASKNPKFRMIMNSQSHRYHQYSGDQSSTSKQLKMWQNTNVLLREGWEGIKTGQTISAGGCLSSLRKGVYIVVLNCPDALKRFTQTKRLYQWYIQKGKDWKTTSTQSFQF